MPSVVIEVEVTVTVTKIHLLKCRFSVLDIPYCLEMKHY